MQMKRNKWELIGALGLGQAQVLEPCEYAYCDRLEIFGVANDTDSILYAVTRLDDESMEDAQNRLLEYVPHSVRRKIVGVEHIDTIPRKRIYTVDGDTSRARA